MSGNSGMTDAEFVEMICEGLESILVGHRLDLACDRVKALIADRDALRQWRFECCEALGLSCAAGAEWTVDDVFRCVQHEESKIIADRDRLTAEVLRLRTALHRIDASVDARPLTSTGSEVGK